MTNQNPTVVDGEIISESTSKNKPFYLKKKFVIATAVTAAAAGAAFVVMKKADIKLLDDATELVLVEGVPSVTDL